MPFSPCPSIANLNICFLQSISYLFLTVIRNIEISNENFCFLTVSVPTLDNKTIKNIQTQNQLEKTSKEIDNRITRLENAKMVRNSRERIKKELKRTKPTKQGAKRIGKYDYESNKLFEDLREYQKQQEALLMLRVIALGESEIKENALIKQEEFFKKLDSKYGS